MQNSFTDPKNCFWSKKPWLTLCHVFKEKTFLLCMGTALTRILFLVQKRGKTECRATYKSFIAPAILREIFMMLMHSVACAFPPLIYCCYYVSICNWNGWAVGLVSVILLEAIHIWDNTSHQPSNQLFPAAQPRSSHHKLWSIIPPPITLSTRQAVTVQMICLKVVIWFIMKATWG